MDDRQKKPTVSKDFGGKKEIKKEWNNKPGQPQREQGSNPQGGQGSQGGQGGKR